jgi:hypothetical protein
MARDNFDVKNYVDVAERIRAFYERYPEGSIQTELVRLEGDMAVFKATVYRDREDVRPTTGWAYEREGVGFVNRTSFIENCETSAIGRALANLNFPTTRTARRRGAPQPATPEQLAEVRMLAESDAIAEEIRERVRARLEHGMTARQAMDAVAYLKKLQREADQAA